MAVQMHSISASAPFFKPPMSVQSSNYFALNSASNTSSEQSLLQSSSGQKKQTPQHQRQQQNNQTSTYFSTNSVQTAKKQKEVSNEREQQSGDRLSALHTRLQLEAEKIRKWKNATEVEIKEKDKKLEDANVTIGNQRKSVTDLQLKKEALSSRLKDEVSNQKEIHRKISSTRDMCTALKNHAVQLDEGISKGEQDRDVLTQLHGEKMETFHSLLARFQQLKVGQKEWMDSQTQILTKEKERSSQFKTHCQSLEQQLEAAFRELSLLREQNKDNEDFINQLTEQLDGKSSMCNSLENDKASLQQSLCARDNDVCKLEDKVGNLQQQLAGTRDLLKEKEGQCSDVQEAFKQAKVIHAQEIATLETSLSSLQANCQQLEGLKSNLELELNQMTSQLKGEIDSLSSQLETTRKQLSVAEGEAVSMKQCLSKEHDLVTQTELDKQLLKKQLANAHTELEQYSDRMSTELKQKDDKIKDMEGLLDKTSTEYQASMTEWKEAKSQFETRLCEVEKDKSELCEKVDSLGQELEKSHTLMADMEANNSDSKEKDAKNIAELMSERQAKVEEILSLKSDIETLGIKQSELMEQCIDKEQLKKENADLKESFQSQSTQVEKLQKELADIQSELGSKNGELSGLIDKYKKDAETAQIECAEVRKTLESQVSDLESKLESSSVELSSLVEKYKAEAESAQQEHEETKKSFNLQVNDLCTVLEKYRAENQKMMSQKDRELESLREQVQESEKAKEANETELSSYRDKVELLQGDLSAKDEEMKELLEAVECLQSKAKMSATPRRTPKPPSDFVTPVHSTIYPADTDETVVSSTPKGHSTVLKKLSSSSVMATPRGTSRPPSDAVRSTPHRMYNYRVSSTPKNSRPPPTPRSSNGNRPKRMRYQSNVDDVETEEMSKFKELYPDAQLDKEETVFKKPKTKGVAVRKASSTTSASKTVNTKYSVRPPLALRNGRPKKNTSEGSKKKKSEDLSWFDSDSVFGFGIDD